MRNLTMLVVVVAMVSAMFATPVLAKVIGGTNEDDELVGTLRADQMSGYNGADTLWGKAGGDDIWGGQGADEIFGNRGADHIAGGVGKDILKAELIRVDPATNSQRERTSPPYLLA